MPGVSSPGNPADILLAAHAEIAVVIGTPPSDIPSDWTFLEGQ